jgi:hypothetical protein
MAANDNRDAGEWGLAFISAKHLRALDQYMSEDPSRSVALRYVFQDWCVQMGYVKPHEIDPDLNFRGGKLERAY